MTRRSSFVLLAGVFALTLGASAITPSLPLERVDRFISERRILAGVPGIFVVMVPNDAVVYNHGYGWAACPQKPNDQHHAAQCLFSPQNL